MTTQELLERLERCERERDLLHDTLNEMVARQLARETGIQQEKHDVDHELQAGQLRRVPGAD